MQLLCVLYTSGLLLMCFSVTVSSQSDTGQKARIEVTQDATSKDSITKSSALEESRDTVTECKRSNESVSPAAKKFIGRQCAPARYRLTVSHPGCISRQVNISACYGVCTSFTSPKEETKNRYSLTSIGCYCCSPVKSSIKRKLVKLHCRQSNRKHSWKFVEEASRCSCRPCVDRHL
jgi:hypothetical protein